jgi:hypothetical protein
VAGLPVKSSWFLSHGSSVWSGDRLPGGIDGRGF